eukprot:g7786.t1
MRGGESEVLWRWSGHFLNAELEVLVPSDTSGLVYRRTVSARAQAAAGAAAVEGADPTEAVHRVALPVVVPDIAAQEAEKEKEREAQRRKELEQGTDTLGLSRPAAEASGGAGRRAAAAREEAREDADGLKPIPWTDFELVLEIPVQLAHQ